MVLGTMLILIVKAMLPFFDDFNALTENLFYILYTAASINFGLFIFNLLPIPPLDGSHIVFSGLNLSPETEERIRKIGLPVLFLILIVQNYAKITIIPIGKMVNAILMFILKI